MAEKGLPLAKFVSEYPEEEAVREGHITVKCPYCGTERLIEPDGNYNDITCETCGEHYRTRGVI